MRIVIAGGTGFIGKALVRELSAAGHRVIVLTRKTSAPVAGAALEQWDGRTVGAWARVIDGADAVVNLAGANLGQGRWTASRKSVLVSSRLEATRALVDAMGQASKKPSVFVSASGTGYYGDVPDGEVAEDRPAGADFLATLCRQWESEARKAPVPAVVILRTGVVLGDNALIIRRFLLPFRMFVGGPLGTGRQWLPWIHRDDHVRVLALAIGGKLSGPVNSVAPESVTMKDFAAALGTAMHRPSWAPVPGFVLRLALGEMADIVLTGQNAVPGKLFDAGYTFKFPRVAEALASAIQG